MEPELVIASSPTDAGIGCWSLHSGTEHLRHRSCASPSHGLVCVGGDFLASSQLRGPTSSTGSVQYWSWNKPQAEVKSFPTERINPLASNSDGTYLVGGGVSGNIYLWEVPTGKLLRTWYAHLRGVTCLKFSHDQSLLISGAEDGCVRVWSLLSIFDDYQRAETGRLYLYSFSEHTLRVTDIVTGYGGCNAIVVSSSEDRTCKVWSLSQGTLLRNVVFPSIIDAVALDPGENLCYAGARDGKIYIASLKAGSISDNNLGTHIVGYLADHSKAVTCLATGLEAALLVSGYEDGTIRVWDTRSRNILRIFKHAKAPVNNILVIKPPVFLDPHTLVKLQSSSLRKHGSSLPPVLEKYSNSPHELAEVKAYIGSQATYDEPLDSLYISGITMNNQIEELQKEGSVAAAGMQAEKLKLDFERSVQMVEQWKRKYESLHEFCVRELLGDQEGDCNGKAT